MATTRDNEGVRGIFRVVTAHKQREGGGFIVRRPFPSYGLNVVDPFLLIDEMGPADYAPGQAVGAPDHPHRGFETVQWMTAGAGIIHSEEPSRAMREKGGRVHGFQIWINLPARLKMSRPRYQEIPAAKIPVARSGDGRAQVRVIAGEALGARAVIDTHTPITYQDWTVAEGADLTLPLAREQQALVYVFEGNLRLGNGDGKEAGGRLVADGQMAILGEGDAVRFRGVAGGARFLLLAGVPLGEPVARYGPFVMNNEAEIDQAVQDYQSGRMGEITRTAEVVHETTWPHDAPASEP
jgi:redox-sensitive bicupin YhaK (pirin superfamily)